MKDQAYPRSRQQDIVMQNIGNEILIYNLKTHKAFSLNETSALVWQECDGTKSVAQIAATISQKLKTPASEDLIWLTIDELNRENLFDNSNELISDFKGMSRRDVIKRVGLGTMIALPVVSAMIAPTSAMAQSIKSNEGGVCTFDTDCSQVNTALACCNPSGAAGQGFCYSVIDGDCGATN